MNKQGRAIFERCPVCEVGVVDEQRSRAFLGFGGVAGRCNHCGATFVQRGSDAFQLRDCGHGTQATEATGGRSICSICLAKSFCLLGRVWSREEWQRLSRGEPVSVWLQYQEQCRHLRAGDLPVLSTAGLPFALEEGEVLHHVSWPVYVGDDVVAGGASTAYRAFLTNRRLLMIRGEEREDLPLAQLVSVEETSPGILLTEVGSPVPRQLYVGVLDPLAAAIAGAVWARQAA